MSTEVKKNSVKPPSIANSRPVNRLNVNIGSGYRSGNNYIPSNNNNNNYLKQEELIKKAKIAVQALRIRGANFGESLDNIMDSLTISEDNFVNGSARHRDSSVSSTDNIHPCVSIPEDVLEALEEYMNDSEEQTLVYKAIQPLVGMVFGKHGSFATHLHSFGASLELLDEKFRIRCPRSKAKLVQDEFEKKLISVLVRLNMDNVTVVMRPEKLMVMLAEWCLTPVIVLGFLSPQLLSLRIFDAKEERRFESINNDMQKFYGQLNLSNQLKDMRLSLPITSGTLACYYDASSHVYMRVVVEMVFETSMDESNLDPNPNSDISNKIMIARIFKIDFGSYSLVPVNELYRLQAPYMQVRRQSIPCRLLFAKLGANCLLELGAIYQEYFSNRCFYALSVGENPINLSHVILFNCEGSDPKISDQAEKTPDFLLNLKDIFSLLVQDKIYQPEAYSMPESFFNKLKAASPHFGSVFDYANVLEQKSSQDLENFPKKCLTQDPETLLQNLLNPYISNQNKRFIPKQNGLVLSNIERNLPASSNRISGAVPSTFVEQSIGFPVNQQYQQFLGSLASNLSTIVSNNSASGSEYANCLASVPSWIYRPNQQLEGFFPTNFNY